MAGIYVYSDKEALTLEMAGLAKKTGKGVNLITFAENTNQIILQCGADKIYFFKGEGQLVESYAKGVAEFLKKKEAELFLVGSTPRGREIAAKVAGYLENAMVSDISSFAYEDGKLVTERIMYGGSVTQAEVVDDGMTVLTVPLGKGEAITGEAAEIITISIEADQRISVSNVAPIVKNEIDLSAADKVVCIGLGMEKKEDMQIAEELAQALGGALGCTRGIAEQRHWLPNYIGISGVTVKPSLYISMGVSGQVQHIVGVRDSKVIVAVDINEKAPIFKAADYGIIGDMKEIIPLLIHEIKNN